MRTKPFAWKENMYSRTSFYIDKPIDYRKEIIMKKEVITVFTAKKARKLLKEGYQIVDIKPDKTDFEGKRTLFLFKYEDGIMESLSSKEN